MIKLTRLRFRNTNGINYEAEKCVASRLQSRGENFLNEKRFHVRMEGNVDENSFNLSQRQAQKEKFLTRKL